jgi:lysophospholipase L1-like esterase
MGRLLVFLATAALVLSGIAVLNWWVDPFGDFWKPGAVAQASAHRPQCLVSHEVIGGAYLPFKLDVFRRQHTRTFVVGSSRVLKIGSWPGERTFANLGMPVVTPEIILRELRALPRDAPPQTMYLGTEAFWFNPSFHGFDVSPSLETKARYVLSRSAVEESLRVLRRAPYVLLHRWRKEEVGHTCVIGRSRPALAWKLDGSRVWSFELEPGTYHPIAEPFTSDLRVLRTGNYADWHTFSSRRVRILDEVLALARARGWRVVGFTPPDGTRYVHFFESDPRIAVRWREYGRLMPKLFRRYGFTWLDFRNPRTIPCSDSDFVDGGYHTNGACSMRMRRRLDNVAKRTLTLVALGDSIPAARPRECQCTTGFVALYAKALAHATHRQVLTRNLAVPGATSSQLLASLRPLYADAVVVMIGHNDTPWVRPGGSAAKLRRNLGAILGRIHAPLVRVANFYDDGGGDPRVVAAYAKTICSVARVHGAGCADVYHAFSPSLLAADHIHPNAAGHRLIAKLLSQLGYATLKARSK